PRAISVDLQPDATLQVDISDALSERDKVKFTVHTKVSPLSSSLPNFKQNEFSVVRQHEEFIWLHDSFVENEEYAGYIIPPAPPRPDFDASREKLQKLGEGEGSMTKEEFTKMKQELEADVARETQQPRILPPHWQRQQQNAIGSRFCKSVSELLAVGALNRREGQEHRRGTREEEDRGCSVQNHCTEQFPINVFSFQDVDDFFDHERTFLVEYHNRVKDASAKSDKMTRSHKCKTCCCDHGISRIRHVMCLRPLSHLCDLGLQSHKIEARVSADEDLKLSDLLKYYLRESQAAKDLLYRRSRSLVDYENANKALDKARAKNKDVLSAETTQQLCCQKFEKISESAKQGT
ncbi:hypothetical protein AB205_0087870, partial [Aquarana catesbeiana]